TSLLCPFVAHSLETPDVDAVICLQPLFREWEDGSSVAPPISSFIERCSLAHNAYFMSVQVWNRYLRLACGRRGTALAPT
ncbi:MAG: hypothetical protein WAU05_01930, partial [Nitrospira sp.]